MLEEKAFSEFVRDKKARAILAALVPEYGRIQAERDERMGEMAFLKKDILPELLLVSDRPYVVDGWQASFTLLYPKLDSKGEGSARLKKLRHILAQRFGRKGVGRYLTSKRVTVHTMDWKLMKEQDPELFRRTLEELGFSYSLTVRPKTVKAKQEGPVHDQVQLEISKD